jgi:hypothetical protein
VQQPDQAKSGGLIVFLAMEKRCGPQSPAGPRGQ